MTWPCHQTALAEREAKVVAREAAAAEAARSAAERDTALAARQVICYLSAGSL